MSPTTTVNRDTVPMGDDIEPVVCESRADVEEEEESLEPELPTVETNPKNPIKSRTRTRRLWTCCLQELVSCLCRTPLC